MSKLFARIPERDRRHADVTIIDVPTFVGGVQIAAAGEGGYPTPGLRPGARRLLNFAGYMGSGSWD
jgi:hypothetical protein